MGNSLFLYPAMREVKLTIRVLQFQFRYKASGHNSGRGKDENDHAVIFILDQVIFILDLNKLILIVILYV